HWLNASAPVGCGFSGSPIRRNLPSTPPRSPWLTVLPKTPGSSVIPLAGLAVVQLQRLLLVSFRLLTRLTAAAPFACRRRSVGSTGLNPPGAAIPRHRQR